MQPGTLTNANQNEQTQDGNIDELPQIRFVRPIPGFSSLRQWILAPAADDETTLYELASLERPEIRFMVATAYGFFPSYDVELDDDICEDLALMDADDALVLVVLTVAREPAAITANLLAPVVINARTRDAAQVILAGSEWPVRAPIG